jgi:hypothetical protein
MTGYASRERLRALFSNPPPVNRAAGPFSMEQPAMNSYRSDCSTRGHNSTENANSGPRAFLPRDPLGVRLFLWWRRIPFAWRSSC